MTPDEIDNSLQSIQGRISNGQFHEALDDIVELNKNIPDNNDSLYMEAVCHRYLNNYELALECLNQLKSRIPEHGRAFQEEGHIYKSSGKPDKALQAYARACRYNPALVASWRGQYEMMQAQGMRQNLKQVEIELARLEKLPGSLLAVSDLISQGRLLKAEDICRRFLHKIPHHVEAMRLLADIGVRLGVLDDAEFLLESAVEFEPGNTRVRVDYIQTLRKRQKYSEALEQAKILLEQEADNPQYQSLYAVVSMQTGNFDEAIDYFDRVLSRLPGDPITMTSKGHALKTCGQYQEAVDAFRSAVDVQPRHGEAYYSLANLKVYSFSDGEIDRMHQQEGAPDLSHMDRIYLSFALGKAYEDMEDYETSFKYYEQGNYLKKIQCRYDPDQMHEDLKAQQQVCTSELFDKNNRAGFPAPDPIFIVGMPRAGSTLLEQIVSSHSQVDGTMELPNILSLTHRLRRRDPNTGRGNLYPDVLATLKPEQLKEYGENFIEDTRGHRQGAPFFIDKMPNNFRHIGLIKLILPNARIIDARRNGMSCCFSNFKQLFAEGQEFTYGLEEVGRYYCDYVELMDHWERVLPGAVLRVEYEDVVADLEHQVRRILDYLELPFELQCLNYYKTDRAVRTPSSEQVRQPIYDSGLEQWRKYESWLGPLKSALAHCNS